MNVLFRFDYQDPIVFTAIHCGHEVRDELKENFIISEENQLREEDPHTDYFTNLVENRIVFRTSRFEVDINRGRERCFYQTPADAWGLEIYKKTPSDAMKLKSQGKYDLFYHRCKIVFDEMARMHPFFFVLDIHSYNHRRNGEKAQPDSPEKNPEIIIGTSNMDYERYSDFIYSVQNKIQDFDYFGRKLDVRINVKYPGGSFARWIHNTYPGKAIAISLEFKKIFMNEWSGVIFHEKMDKLKKMLSFLLPELNKLIKEEAKRI